VEPPKYNQPLSKIDDPLFQEWTDSGAISWLNFTALWKNSFATSIPSRHDNNPHSGLSGNNSMWDQGLDYPRLLTHTDYVLPKREMKQVLMMKKF